LIAVHAPGDVERSASQSERKCEHREGKMRGRKKVRLSPIVIEILSFPDDSGLASLPQLLGHLQELHSDLPPAKLLEQVERAVLKCRRLGYLYLQLLSLDKRKDVPIWEWSGPTLSTFISWDEAERRWQIHGREQPVEDILIQLTQGAVNDLRRYQQQASSRRGPMTS
jgi:hypothetical protein